MNARDPILDEAVLEDLALLGRELAQDVLGEVVGAFRKYAPGLLEEMVLACGERGFGRLRKAAHALKGSSAQLGARRVSALAREIEADARAQREDRLVSLLARCRDELAQADAALSRLLRPAR